jgi:hypothetical protein
MPVLHFYTFDLNTTEIPKGSKVCVLPVPFNVQECIVAVKEMLQP